MNRFFINKFSTSSLTLVVLFFFIIIATRQTLTSSLLTLYANQNFHWQSTILKSISLTKSGSVHWLQLVVQGKFPKFYLALHKNTNVLKINIIDANLNAKDIYLTPVLAKTTSSETPYSETLQDMGQNNPNLLAGINGGYFFINSSKKQHDQNCLGKHFPELTSQGVGDGLLIINNNAYATNCETNFFSEKYRTSIVQNTNQQWQIANIAPNTIPTGMVNGLGAGPGLINTINNKPQIAIHWEGIFSTFEFSANSAVILTLDSQHHTHVIFFTVDGSDKLAGMNAMEMANYIYTILPKTLHEQIISAMSMDQGHSTTMYVKNSNPQIVSNAAKDRSARDIFDGLFIAARA
ncbi:MAG: hypothetical protein A3E87_05585 [Gammaproteobacteria bacterium RIFCSPHIGHO2_12_FULL_35_23]|nr:MAG: hypothetical protein A3E87_05585 [Gammaproteobacteria bacterium RIFCSPHIGHO2_12_FULL_35_23]